MEADDPVAVLERWTAEGAGYRVLALEAGHAEVELLSCTGEPVDRLVSGDPRLIELLSARPRSDPGD